MVLAGQAAVLGAARSCPLHPSRSGQMMVTWLWPQGPAAIWTGLPLMCDSRLPLTGLQRVPCGAGFQPLMLNVGFRQQAFDSSALGTFFPRKRGKAPPNPATYLRLPHSSPES